MRSRPACWCSLAVLALLAPGCVRAGFGASGGDGAAFDSVTGGELGGVILDRDHDTCATAFTVDANAALAVPVTIALDFTGAKNDYNVAACRGYPELVLRLVNVSALGILTKSCGGGGQLLDFAPESGCPLGGGGSSSTISCTPGNFQSLLVREGGGYLLLCRDPASQPRLTLTLGSF
jgi:hypothetical protein